MHIYIYIYICVQYILRRTYKYFENKLFHSFERCIFKSSYTFIYVENVKERSILSEWQIRFRFVRIQLQRFDA